MALKHDGLEGCKSGWWILNFNYPLAVYKNMFQDVSDKYKILNFLEFIKILKWHLTLWQYGSATTADYVTLTGISSLTN